jgi:SWI/SNF chromatin-remodeling complex subunit SWI1
VKTDEKAIEKVKADLPTDMVEGKMTYRPSWRTIDRWSGLDLDAENLKKKVDELLFYQPNMPSLLEMGVVDIRALTMSIRSGLLAETRLGLDMLAKLTNEQQLTLELEKCDDLVEVLVDYGEDLLDTLANDNPEVSDILDLTPYEEVINNCNVEAYALQEPPEFGTQAYELDRTADRLLAITTILRNLSFLEINHTLLTSAPVLKFFSNAIRLVGTRVLLLRTHINTFDFMKDLVTFLSNTSTKIMLPSREDAYTILHFLCAFAPIPRPSVPVKFTPYNPKIHRCLPSAVDSLAKLLARDDPNRTYYKQIFAAEATSSPPYDLLTRAFGLAIAVVPDYASGFLQEVANTRSGKELRHIETRLADYRKPYLMQGMLAADILASLAPGPETGVCRSWLEATDGWAPSLLKFAMGLCAHDAQNPPPAVQHQVQGRGQRPINHDVEGYQLITHRALSVLKRLGEKTLGGGDVLVKGGSSATQQQQQQQTNGHTATEHEDKDGDNDEDDDDDDDMEDFSYGGRTWRIKADFLPKKDTVLSALLMPQLDSRSLRAFCGIGYLDDTR